MINAKLKCSRCGHEWVPRTENPIACPECKSRYWKEEKDGIKKRS